MNSGNNGEYLEGRYVYPDSIEGDSSEIAIGDNSQALLPPEPSCEPVEGVVPLQLMQPDPREGTLIPPDEMGFDRSLLVWRHKIFYEKRNMTHKQIIQHLLKEQNYDEKEGFNQQCQRNELCVKHNKHMGRCKLRVCQPSNQEAVVFKKCERDSFCIKNNGHRGACKRCRDNSTPDISLIENCKKFITTKDITQKSLAESLGLAQSALSYWFNGKYKGGIDIDSLVSDWISSTSEVYEEDRVLTSIENTTPLQ